LKPVISLSTHLSARAGSAATPSSPQQQDITATSSCDPRILDRLRTATRKEDVRRLLQRHDVNEVNAAWQQLTPVERSALLLCKHFDGTIVPDFTELD
jgi:hypothetical protein